MNFCRLKGTIWRSTFMIIYCGKLTHHLIASTKILSRAEKGRDRHAFIDKWLRYFSAVRSDFTLPLTNTDKDD
jgi:hypothetical protein